MHWLWEVCGYFAFCLKVQWQRQSNGNALDSEVSHWAKQLRASINIGLFLPRNSNDFIRETESFLCGTKLYRTL